MTVVIFRLSYVFIEGYLAHMSDKDKKASFEDLKQGAHVLLSGIASAHNNIINGTQEAYESGTSQCSLCLPFHVSNASTLQCNADSDVQRHHDISGRNTSRTRQVQKFGDSSKMGIHLCLCW
jgi:hypothetical protein